MKCKKFLFRDGISKTLYKRIREKLVSQTNRIMYMVYDYQLYIANDIRNAANPTLPAVHAFDRWKFYEYQPVQGRVTIKNPKGFTA